MAKFVRPSKADVRGEALHFDAPLPGWISPSKPTLVIKPPPGPEWQHEIKWDGYRISIAINDGKVTIYSSTGLDFTNRFPAIATAAAGLPVRNAVIDGEAVVLDDRGRSRFGLLQAALKASGAHEAVVFVFDLLFFDGLDIRDWPLDTRRMVLEGLIAGAPDAIRFSEELLAPGPRVFAIACEHELEGIVSKRRDRPYRSGRVQDWLKVKCIKHQAYTIIGYQPGKHGGLGALHVASEEGVGLTYRGSVGTGFSERVAADLKRAIDSIEVSKAPIVGLRIKGARWCQPLLKANVAFRDLTEDGILRHSSFAGLE